MKPTIKSINAAMPRLDAIRKNYMFHGETGYAHGYGYLKAAFADLDDNGNVTNITLYAVGDAMERRHYYNEPGTIAITYAINAALEDWEMNRHAVCCEIQNMIRRRTETT